MKLRTKTLVIGLSTLIMIIGFIVLKKTGGVSLGYAWFPASVLIGSWIILIKEHLNEFNSKHSPPIK